ncbi:OmpA family protein [Streptomyces sp. NPDC005423]|uniref:OmpA family protein n=1 Tax=Streptomyces sp. NPDC005423 TaxID=3155343 RepID=UPI00339EB2A6
MRPIRPRPAILVLALTGLTVVLSAVPPGMEQAAASPYGSGSGLALRDGGVLAPPRILGIGSDPAALSQVVGDQDGSERRRDTNEDVTYELQAEVLFAKDSAQLGTSARARIAVIAREISQQRPTTIRVVGFTDDLGSSAHGDVLSLRRADAVRTALAGGLPSTAVFETRGCGERYPVASNSTEAGRRQNRRVEISFARTGSWQP